MELYDETVNAEYMPSRRVPNAQEYFATWQQESASFREQHPPTEYAYGSGQHETLDVFEPGGGAKASLLWIHGGYWMAFYKDHFSYVAPPLLALGVRVAVMSYDLVPGVTLRHIVRQARQAAAFMAEQFPVPLIVAGHSAGGHLAAMIHCTDWQAEGLTKPDLVGSIGISGLYDLSPLRYTELQPKLTLSEAEARALSPVFQSPTTDAPFIVAAGELESAAFKGQSQQLSTAWAGLVSPPQPLAGRHHFDAPDDLAPLVSLLLKERKG